MSSTSTTSVSTYDLEQSGCTYKNPIAGCESGRLEYPYPSNVDRTRIEEIKLLSGVTDYDLWQKQMMGLIKGHGMQGFIDGTFKNPKENHDDSRNKEMEAKYKEWKRSDTVVKEWILNRLSENVIGIVDGLKTANDIWKKLKTTYCTPTLPTITATNGDPPEYLPLCRALARRSWEEAQNLLNQMDRNAFTAILDSNSYSAIHHAIELGGENIEFVKYILKHMDPNSLPNLVNGAGRNPLHNAALVGYTEAARILVEKNPHLLFRVNNHLHLPIHTAILNSHRITCLYLLHACKQYSGLAEQHGYLGAFEGRNGTLLLTSLITEGHVDVAYDLIKEYPDIATTAHDNFDAPLLSIGAKFDFYYSGTQYNSYQKFVYSHVAKVSNKLGNTEKVPDIENQHTYKDKVVNLSRRSCCHAGLLFRDSMTLIDVFTVDLLEKLF